MLVFFPFLGKSKYRNLSALAKSERFDTDSFWTQYNDGRKTLKLYVEKTYLFPVLVKKAHKENLVLLLSALLAEV